MCLLPPHPPGTGGSHVTYTTGYVFEQGYIPGIVR